MKDINKLKKLNILEKLGFMLLGKQTPKTSDEQNNVDKNATNKKSSKKKKLNIIFTIIAIISFAGLISDINYKSDAIENKEYVAKYLNESNDQLNSLSISIATVDDKLNSNKAYLKDYDQYQDYLTRYRASIKNHWLTLHNYKKLYDDEDINAILDFILESETTSTIISENDQNIMINTLNQISSEVDEVVFLHNNMMQEFDKLTAKKNSLVTSLEPLNKKNEEINQNSNSEEVIRTASKLYDDAEYMVKNTLDSFDLGSVYSDSDKGKYSLSELRDISNNYSSINEKIVNVDKSIESFNNYYLELTDEYYTIVTKQYHSKKTDTVTEKNPKYKEWTEKESYETVEKYTEKEYVGSRIVGDKKEDIYEKVTKTRPVTKTRTVHKDNGKPEKIKVTYDVYTYYYEYKRTSKSGTETISKLSGEKHEKYDSNIRKWNYDEEEEVGYVVWKKKWTPYSSILSGFNIKPSLN